MQQLRLYCSTQFQIINRNMCRYYAAPARPIGRRTAAAPMAPRFGGIGAPALPLQPLQRQQQQAPQAPAQPNQEVYDNARVDPDAKLGRPKSLLDLWHEWCHGLQGNKAARLFTPTEKGQNKVKFKFSRRNNFWLVMRHLTLGRGYSELAAIDLIEQCYGSNLPVTMMLKKLCEAKEKGYHPNLDMNNPNLNNRGARQRLRRVAQPQQQALPAGQRRLINV